MTVKSNDGGVLDLERCHAPKLVARAWQCDTSESSWFCLRRFVTHSGEIHMQAQERSRPCCTRWPTS